MLEILHYRNGIQGKLEGLLSRPIPYWSSDIEIEVKAIVDTVRDLGDEALVKLTKEFDGVNLSQQGLRISLQTIEQAYRAVDDEFLTAIREAIANVTRYHQRQKVSSWSFSDADGVDLEEHSVPLERAGLYVPGGKALYPSSIVMNAVPAKVAGVNRIIVALPPGNAHNPYILVTLGELNLGEIYTIGGAQAIAAMAFGTETVPRVDKIVGPGNIYVTLAKRYVYGVVDIDMLAGPSEVVILADQTANPQFIAADMLAQAEHDQMALAVCITTSQRLAEQIQREIARQIKGLKRREIIAQALTDHGVILIVEALDEGVELVNRIAPEHLELMTANPRQTLPRIRNAGAIFLGHYSPVPVGDYFAGTNHVLPTGGTARFSSPLSVYDFLKRYSVVEYSRSRIEKKGHLIRRLAHIEELGAHEKAIELREQEHKDQELKKSKSMRSLSTE
ncbi:MAG: histidinol dehydrogenase [Candidatus Latescibacteria bacterium 4484_181]|nr:MAG: histidinol dehydrogenase [Candidatus Latescibacteria bacterium 4484_181]